MTNELPAVVFDIDGTVALRDKGPEGREPYDMTRVGEDQPNVAVLEIAKMIAASGKAKVVFFSGRDSSARRQTKIWLDHHFGTEYHVYMRAEGDKRPDEQVKADMYGYLRAFRPILAVFDDRNKVVDMWREKGLTCFQVCSREQGNF